MGEKGNAQDDVQPVSFLTESRAELPDPEKHGAGHHHSNANSQRGIPPADGAPPDEASYSDSEPTTLLGDETYPEGGLQAWLVVFGSWCALLASLGIMNSLATFQTYIGTHQLADYDEGTIGWIFSLYSALTFFCGIYIGPLFDRFGPRWLILPGSICVVASMMALSVCTGR